MRHSVAAEGRTDKFAETAALAGEVHVPCVPPPCLDRMRHVRYCFARAHHCVNVQIARILGVEQHRDAGGLELLWQNEALDQIDVIIKVGVALDQSDASALQSEPPCNFSPHRSRADDCYALADRGEIAQGAQ